MILGRFRIMCKPLLKHAIALLCALSFSLTSFACECGAPAPACAYVSAAPVIFVGTPVYSNDDGSGTFLQQTLYKFKVDEIFKGLPEGTEEVWVDPGSYTSCYAEYNLGVKLLVFASETRFIPVDTAAMTVAKPMARKKPLPPGFDPKMPVYYAPECSGTRRAESAADDIAWLRLWKKGDTRTRIQGLVIDRFRRPLPGAKVIARSGSGDLTTISDPSGAFSLEPVKPGKYDLSTKLAGYQMAWNPQIVVQEHACGYASLRMGASGVLSGMVADKNGKPVVGVEVDLALMRGKEETFPPIHHESSHANGSFRYEDLPEGDYLIGVNLESQPDVDAPYAPTYAPGVSDRQQAQVIHLAAGQKLSGIRLQLPPRMRLRTVHVQVKWPDGRSAGSDVSIETDERQTSMIDFEDTKTDGSALVRCFAAKGCTIQAKKWLTKPGEDAKPQIAASLPRQIKAGEVPVSITLILTETKSHWDQ